MRIGFVDPIDWDYNVESVYERPLGGSQSALCYLTVALARRGHEVFVFNETSAPGCRLGVQCYDLRSVSAADVRGFALDVIVILNSADLAAQVRPALPGSPKLVLWSQHAADQPGVRGLADAEARDAHDALALVSQWQRDQYAERFGVSRAKTCVLRNAIAPAFGELFSPGERIVDTKARPPILAYTSTPFRGLDVLLEVFPEIRRAVPETRLQVFSSMRVYDVSEEEDERQFGRLYRACRSTEGVEYVGSLRQTELAEQLRSVWLLAYANTFAETSCIAIMEAMAAGCRVVTSRLGALPETTAGFATLVSPHNGWDQYKQSFRDACIEALRDDDGRAGELEDRLEQQVTFARQSYNWDDRAQQWESWLSSLPGR